MVEGLWWRKEGGRERRDAAPVGRVRDITGWVEEKKGNENFDRLRFLK